MLLTLIFLSQTLLAQQYQPSINVQNMQPKKRVSPIQEQDDSVIASVCEYIDSFAKSSCISRYNQEGANFTEDSLSICKSFPFNQFMGSAQKKKCVEQVKNRLFNRSELSTCLQKETNRQGVPRELDAYISCLTNPDNLADKSAASKGKGSR